MNAEMKKQIDQCAIVINACDKTKYYYDGWNWFFQKYWNKKCPWNVYFATETVSVNFPGTVNLKVGRCSWKEYLVRVFEKINSDYVLFAMDDHFFLKTLTCIFLYDVFKYSIENNQDRFGLMKTFSIRQEPTKQLPDFHGYPHRQLTEKSNYIFSLQPSVWRTNFMLQIVEDNWMPWDGEWQGTLKIKAEKIPAKVSYVEIDQWYGEAYRLSQPRSGDYEMLRSIYDWEKPDHCKHWGNR